MRFVITENLVRYFALLVLAALAFGLHWAVSTKSPDPRGDPVRVRRRGLKGLVIGSDGRASTSKVQALLWTTALLYALTFLLLWGRSVGCTSSRTAPECAEAGRGRDAFVKTVEAGIQPEYYVLLGFPLAAALTSKAMTSAKVADETLEKPTIRPDQEGIVQGITEVVSNDEGETDLLDFQYFAFTLLSLTFFAFEFLADPGAGLPELPPALIALSGLSTAGYTVKKALETGAWEGPAAEPKKRSKTSKEVPS